MLVSYSKSAQAAAIIRDRPPRDRASARNELFCALLPEARPIALTDERLLATQAIRLLMLLDREVIEARAQWNQDWFRRVMHARSKAASRVQRRWGRINPPPSISLGTLRRRYHANLARYLYEPR
jgi:hypothetical protein